MVTESALRGLISRATTSTLCLTERTTSEFIEVRPPRSSSNDHRHGATVLLSTRATNHEESQLSKRAMFAVGKGCCWSRLLQDQVGERRYQCETRGKTFCSTSRTAYYRLKHRRATFDEVASLSVEGLNKSAIARVKRIAWNTVHRWLERAVAWCRRFNNRKIKRLSGAELQADEIRTIVGSKQQSIWVFAVIDVWSRLRRFCRYHCRLPTGLPQSW